MYLIKNNVFSVQFLMWHFKERLFDDMISIIQIIILMAKKPCENTQEEKILINIIYLFVKILFGFIKW